MPKRYINRLEHDTMWLIVFNGVANLALGVSFLLFANTAAESVLNKFFPINSWAYLWIAIGVVGLLGVWSRSMARFSFVIGGMVIAVFTVASIWAVIVDGQLRAIPTTVFLLYIWGLLWGISRLIVQRENILAQIDQLVDRGQNKLDAVQEQRNEDDV